MNSSSPWEFAPIGHSSCPFLRKFIQWSQRHERHIQHMALWTWAAHGNNQDSQDPQHMWLGSRKQGAAVTQFLWHIFRKGSASHVSSACWTPLQLNEHLLGVGRARWPEISQRLCRKELVVTRTFLYGNIWSKKVAALWLTGLGVGEVTGT